MKSISILGATGSVGTSTLKLIAAHRDRFSVSVVSAHSNADKLARIARDFDARIAVITDPSAYEDLKQGLAGTDIQALAGMDALCYAIAEDGGDLVMASIVGSAGLRPTMAAVKAGRDIGLANKEVLVCAGALFMEQVAQHDVTLLPVDSEHNAIFQVFERENRDAITGLILTASGGPFRTRSRSDLQGVTPAEAVAHPNWSMGAKISVDSATMMNKGLELIEAAHLFAMPEDQIDILVHPQSIIHSLVEYADGSQLAQLGPPDMVVPIASALAWPKRIDAPVDRLDLAQVATLSFEQPDMTRFPCMRLARDVLRAGGSAPAILNAANEVAVAAFLAEKLPFTRIEQVVEDSLAKMSAVKLSTLDDVMHIDADARIVASEIVELVASRV
ncbi:1-deoxy-D-xylulose-5-phosphate reductoisomerase [Gymnodinialimonas sp.]